MYFSKFGALCTLLASPLPLTAQEEVNVVADDYLEAVQAQDWEAMAGFLTEASVYQDFTMEYYDREAVDLVGRDAIVEFWRTSSEDSGTSEIHYDVEKRFTAGPCVVLTLALRVRVSGEFFGVPKSEIELTGDLITFLRIEDGKVTHHVDYVNYGQVAPQIEALKNR